MGDEETRVTRIAMPDGTPVWARISGAEELAVPSGELSYTDVGFTDRVEAHVESLQSVVTGVARSLAVPLRAVRPDEVSVEFGIELTAKAGKVVGLLADGEAKAGIKVTLTWNGGPPDTVGTDSDAPPPGPWHGTPGHGPGGTPPAPGTEGPSAEAPQPAPRPGARGDGAPPGCVCAGASTGASVHGGVGGPVTGSGA
ncbi:hypothetical protein GCM10010145_08660 [Streptomyces ruber]|uniref:Trypsin-co-occurring domain-containing protein n=2 Tax=Streptomyces TaxID=1883 RepID=A0A918B835_9ACTN|nr:CU044_2847 family protein [Streptomyces ruber]GGQ42221.1 hypothetical protein GCM10010145_08660 [Streptomyces ruber]